MTSSDRLRAVWDSSGAFRKNLHKMTLEPLMFSLLSVVEIEAAEAPRISPVNVAIKYVNELLISYCFLSLFFG